jgi:type III pantothenate kinase
MVCLIDVGNSNVVFGFTDFKNKIKTYRFKTLVEKTSDEYYLMLKAMLDAYKIDDVLISSVVPVLTSAFIKMFKEHFSVVPTVVGQGIKTGIQLKVDDPKTVGADIICDCVGAMQICDEALIIDLGTATKYIYCSKNTFYGVSIAPGVSISMKAMVSSAALLPNIELIKPEKIIGTNTINCMQSGIMYSSAASVDGMINRIKKEINKPNIKVIATGGLSKLIIPICENEIILEEDLTIKGLQKIYLKNVAH